MVSREVSPPDWLISHLRNRDLLELGVRLARNAATVACPFCILRVAGSGRAQLEVAWLLWVDGVTIARTAAWRHAGRSSLQRLTAWQEVGLYSNALTSEGRRMRDEVRAAYRLIYDYKSGQIEPGSAISQDQRRLLHLLAADLEVEVEGVEIGTLVGSVARADTRWNHETMAALADFHDLRAAGRADEAEAVRTRFLGSCPSVWYCAILTDV